jgi:hypothetical protein
MAEEEKEREVKETRLGLHPIRCGCILHTQSDDVVGCPVYQVERLTELVAEMEGLWEKEKAQSVQADSLLDLAKQVLAGEGIVDFEVQGKDDET